MTFSTDNPGGLQQPPLRKICLGKTLRITRVNPSSNLQFLKRKLVKLKKNLVSFGRGSTILEKKVVTVCLIWFKNSPHPPIPQCNVGPSHSARGRARSLNIDWWGVGKEMTNGELGGIFKTMHCPKCPYNREHWDNCSKVGQVSQLFFSRIVDLFIFKRFVLECVYRAIFQWFLNFSNQKSGQRNATYEHLTCHCQKLLSQTNLGGHNWVHFDLRL